MSTRDYRQYDPDDPSPYGRPSVSAWIAVAAVAMAIFVAGGYIKTYLQMEALREESRREIQDLRRRMDGLRTSVAGDKKRAARATSLPNVERPVIEANRQERPPRADEAMARSTTTAPNTALGEVRTYLPEMNETPSKVTYEFGRRSRPANANQAKGGFGDAFGGAAGAETIREQYQVVFVSIPQKRVMVDVGRNGGLEEGARLELFRQGKYICDLRVLEAFANQASCEFAHAPRPPEPGDTVRIP